MQVAAPRGAQAKPSPAPGSNPSSTQHPTARQGLVPVTRGHVTAPASERCREGVKAQREDWPITDLISGLFLEENAIQPLQEAFSMPLVPALP